MEKVENKMTVALDTMTAPTRQEYFPDQRQARTVFSHPSTQPCHLPKLTVENDFTGLC